MKLKIFNYFNSTHISHKTIHGHSFNSDLEKEHKKR